MSLIVAKGFGMIQRVTTNVAKPIRSQINRTYSRRTTDGLSSNRTKRSTQNYAYSPSDWTSSDPCKEIWNQISQRVANIVKEEEENAELRKTGQEIGCILPEPHTWEATNDVDELNKRIIILQRENKMLKSRIDLLTRDIVDLKKRVDELETGDEIMQIRQLTTTFESYIGLKVIELADERGVEVDFEVLDTTFKGLRYHPTLKHLLEDAIKPFKLSLVDTYYAGQLVRAGNDHVHEKAIDRAKTTSDIDFTRTLMEYYIPTVKSYVPRHYKANTKESLERVLFAICQPRL